MLEKFKKYCSEKLCFTEKTKVLVGVSGGRDSVFLIHMLHLAGYDFAIAHFNFGLRGNESELDALFCKELATHYQVPFFTKKEDAKKTAKQLKISTQEAARSLRYAWFHNLISETDFSALAVGQHKDDLLETQLINLMRGTGLRGLHGILSIRDHVVRPLMCFGRSDVDEGVEKYQLKYREDSSNASDDYMRNAIRHHVIPPMRKIQEDVVEKAITLSENVLQTEVLLDQLMDQQREKLLKKEAGCFQIPIIEIENKSQGYLYEFFRPFAGFNYQELLRLCRGETGRILTNNKFEIVKNRDHLLLRAVKETFFFDMELDLNTAIETPLGIMTCELLQSSFEDLNFNDNICVIPARLLESPLRVRSWSKGDWMVPLGMKGRKKISDLLIDDKCSLFEKQKALVLVSGDNITWLIGHRTDDRFKVVDKTEKLYLFSLKISRG